MWVEAEDIEQGYQAFEHASPLEHEQRPEVNIEPPDTIEGGSFPSARFDVAALLRTR